MPYRKFRTRLSASTRSKYLPGQTSFTEACANEFCQGFRTIVWSPVHVLNQHSVLFEPRKPLIAAYQGLLDNWKTQDQNTFAHHMRQAAEFHISRSKYSTGSKSYEFDYDFDRVFPIELLAVLALRRRGNLADFPTGHVLIDGPWSVLKDLPCAEPHSLIAAVLKRIKSDYPQFL
ncbi:hypothetical protein K5D56_01200 [Pseudomonas cichorii]|nr:hypothetical protein [Pseudomonas cichorii]MBX8587985.1 hypothetical protein [Pseudomonas cichorii]